MSPDTRLRLLALSLLLLLGWLVLRWGRRKPTRPVEMGSVGAGWWTGRARRGERR